METGADNDEHLASVRLPWMLVVVYTFFYAAVFVAGLIGNIFVVLAVMLNSNLRSVTDYLISSLAFADLLIILFCLPTTLLNNLLTEWQLGAIGCKLSTFINSTTSCASIFTLVAVTADRYLAICHTLKYTLWEARPVIYWIFVIWFISAFLALPNLYIYDEILYDLEPPNGTLVARLCISTKENFLQFIIVNLIIAFLLPIILICVSYSLIFFTVSHHRSLAVDARIRDERVKLRVAQMMLTVIIIFMLCWTPLYGLYCYLFLASDRGSTFFHFSTTVLRPIFQWLSLLSSSLNPLIYIAYSQKYRRAFHQLLLLPCRVRYQSLRRTTRTTFRLLPLKTDLNRSGNNANNLEFFEPYTGNGSQATSTPREKFGRKIFLQQNQYYYYNNHNLNKHKHSNESAYDPNYMQKMSKQSSCHNLRETSRQSFEPSINVNMKKKLIDKNSNFNDYKSNSIEKKQSYNKKTDFVNYEMSKDTCIANKNNKIQASTKNQTVDVSVEMSENSFMLKSPITVIKSYVKKRRQKSNKKLRQPASKVQEKIEGENGNVASALYSLQTQSLLQDKQ